MIFMSTLTKSNLNDDIQKLIIQNITLFRSYVNVYLFGSTLNKNVLPKDIDLLLIYSDYFDEIVEEAKQIRYVLKEALNLPVDLTVLSLEELKNTSFLKKIINYIKLK